MGRDVERRQTCIGTERVYVHENVFDAFMTEILDQAKDLRAGSDSGAQIGPITMPSQLGVIRSHLDDAVARGARIALGGPDAVGERFVQPTILTHVRRTPPRSPRRPSGRRSRSTRSRAWTRPYA